MRKVSISVNRVSGDKCVFTIPDNLSSLEVRGIVEAVMEQLQFKDLAPKAQSQQEQTGNLLERGEHA